MLTFYERSNYDYSIKLLFMSREQKSILISIIIKISEIFNSNQLYIFLFIKWFIYIVCCTHFINTLKIFVKDKIAIAVVSSFTILHFPNIVHMPQILRDELVTGFFLLSLSALYRIETNELGLKFYKNTNKVVLLIAYLGLFFTRPEFALLLILIVLCNIIIFSKSYIKYIILILSLYIFQTFNYFLSNWYSEIQGIRVIDAFKDLIFSPVPYNVIDVLSAKRSHSLAAIWYLVTVPFGFLLMIASFLNLLTSYGKRLIRINHSFKIFCIYPTIFIAVLCSITFAIQGPRQTLSLSLVLGVYLYLFCFKKINERSIFTIKEF